MRRPRMLSFVVTVVLLASALPAGAAPDNHRNEGFEIQLDCGAHGEFTVKPQPGNGNAAWDVDTGEVLVAKHFTGHFEITATITGGPTFEASFDFAQDFGSKGVANGRAPLATCTSHNEFVDGPFVIDEQIAGFLNSDFQTDVFEAGQEVTISGSEDLTILVQMPGS